MKVKLIKWTTVKDLCVLESRRLQPFQRYSCGNDFCLYFFGLGHNSVGFCQFNKH